MGGLGRLYPLNNKTIKKTINIEDKLYQKLLQFVKNNYDATFSDIINVCIEEYVERNEPSFYEKPKHVTRLLNGAVKEFLEKYDK